MVGCSAQCCTRPEAGPDRSEGGTAWSTGSFCSQMAVCRTIWSPTCAPTQARVNQRQMFDGAECVIQLFAPPHLRVWFEGNDPVRGRDQEPVAGDGRRGEVGCSQNARAGGWRPFVRSVAGRRWPGRGPRACWPTRPGRGCWRSGLVDRRSRCLPRSAPRSQVRHEPCSRRPPS